MKNIQWFPGHMAKTRRMLKENMKMVDVVIELLDARIPRSSQNPEIAELTKSKPRVIVLNKSDLADSNKSKLWKEYFHKTGIDVVYVNSLTGEGIKELLSKLRANMRSKIEKAKDRGRISRPIKTMVVGIPNVGKSAFINRIAGKATALTGDKPGVTRAKQWVRINPQVQLMDTPGVLWPKFEDEETALNLAFTGTIKDEIMDVATIAARLFERLSVLYPAMLDERFKLMDLDAKTGMELLYQAGRNRGCLVSGGEVDPYRIANIVLNEFRSGKIGRITLETP